MLKCLKCEKELKYVWKTSTNIEDGGDLNVGFHYGSRHDMCDDFGPRPDQSKYPIDEKEPRHVNLRSCDYVRGFICDDCFEKHADLFHGYNGKGQDQKEVL